VTVSFGVGWFLQEDRGPDAAFQRADAALYRAKAEGKNRVQTQGAPQS
jgi:PleD family two-component response regulator